MTSNGGIFWPIWLAILPLAITLPVVFGASILVGLPLTAAFKRGEQESAGAQIGAGIATGAGLPVAILFLLDAPQDYWLALPGAISGAVTANLVDICTEASRPPPLRRSFKIDSDRSIREDFDFG